MLLKGREGRGRAETANGRGARIAAARQSECVANTMHISHCSWPPPFLRKERTILQSAALDCNSLGTRSMRPCLAWLQSKQNWPFLRLYLSLILLHLFFPLRVSTACSQAEGGGSPVPERRRRRKGPTATNPPCFPTHGRAREARPRPALYHVPIFMPWKTHTEGGRKYYPE